MTAGRNRCSRRFSPTVQQHYLVVIASSTGGPASTGSRQEAQCQPRPASRRRTDKAKRAHHPAPYQQADQGLTPQPGTLLHFGHSLRSIERVKIDGGKARA